MRYVPNLIPEKNKVLKDYFKGSIYQQAKKNELITIVSSIVGGLLLFLALISINHFLMMLLYAIAGFIFIPFGHNLIEKKFRFRFTTKIKSVFSVLLMLIIIPVMGYYTKIDKKKAYEQGVQNAILLKNKTAADKKEKIRKDSLNFYIRSSIELSKNHKPDNAKNQLVYASTFAVTDDEKHKINNTSDFIQSRQVYDLVDEGKYKEALPKLNSLIAHYKKDGELIYNRAICLSKIGKIEAAVNDCRDAIAYGNSEAEALYNKINPIRKKIAYYVTRCCDGTTSSASGRGACSHHGGVCDWSDPVYEEYRKY